MSARALWILSIPLALLAWAGIIVFTAVTPPTLLARGILLPLLALAMTMTLAPVIWIIARSLKIPGTGERPALALRSALWTGLWIAICVGLQFIRGFNWVLALALAAVLILVESFLLQFGRQQPARQQSTKRAGKPRDA